MLLRFIIVPVLCLKSTTDLVLTNVSFMRPYKLESPKAVVQLLDAETES